MRVSVSSLPYGSNIVESLNIIENSGADFLHLDIMDGSMTKNSTFDFKMVREINTKSTIFLDCHLMVKNPQIEKYLCAQVNLLTVHFEAYDNKNKLINDLEKIRKRKALAGLSICPKTKVEDIEFLKDYIDVLLIMSVEIGEYGQSYIKTTNLKIQTAKILLPNVLIEVDGGVNEDNIELLKELGVDIVAVGGSFFNSTNKKKFIANIKK